jgi:hypothetical protein
VISLGRYLAGCGELALVLGALGFAAFQLRRWAIPSWSGAPARLAEAIVAIAIVVWVGEILGALTLFKAAPVILALFAVPIGAGLLARSRARAGDDQPLAAPPVSRIATVAALAAVAFLVALWSLDTLRNLDRGMYGFDTLWYHMPFAASYVQSGSVTGLHFTDPLYLNWFYPANSELIHATGILFFDRDLLSPLINLGWLGLALLAAWCIGRPYGVGALSMLGVCVLLGTRGIAGAGVDGGQAGDAKNDIVGIALLMSAVALLINAGPQLKNGARRAWPAGPLVVAGLAAGLAAGTKLDLLAAVALLTVGVIVVTPSGARRVAALAFGLPLVLAGGFWYARNLVSTGNPLPWVKHLGPIPLPHPERPIEGRAPFTVAHYLFDASIYRHYFFPGLDKAFGAAWPVLIALAGAGMAMTALRGRTAVVRMLGAVALLAVVAYLFTPLSASGPEGHPVGFFLNLRYVAPALAIGLALLPVGLVAGSQSWRFELRRGPALVAAVAVFAALLLIGDDPAALTRSTYTRDALVLAFVLVPLPLALFALGRGGGPARALPAFAIALVAVLGVGVGRQQSQDYLRHRYTLTPYSSFNLDRAYQWARDRHGERIGLAGTTIAFFQYGLYGTDLSNRVEYVGERTPHGGLRPILGCRDWREAVNRGRYGYVVTSPFLNQNAQSQPIASPERRWLRTDPGARLVLRDAGTAVFRITRPLDPAGCAALGPAARISLSSLNPRA